MKKLFFLFLLGISFTVHSQDMRYCPDMKYPVKYHGFVVDWDTLGRIPNLVYYTVSYDSLQSFGRTSFGTDENIINPSYTWEYTNTGYDRGHMMPSASAQNYDMWEDCYWMTNIAPQTPNLNRKLWKNIETFERDNSWPIVYIIIGHIGEEGEFETGIKIPYKFYKILYNPEYEAMITFLCSQEDGNRKMNQVVKTVDEIEELTGIDFFKQMPKRKQKKLESYSNLKDWW